MNETKQEVFDALLSETNIHFGCYEVEDWQKRYEKAEIFGRSHDVDDLYEEYERLEPTDIPIEGIKFEGVV